MANRDLFLKEQLFSPGALQPGEDSPLGVTLLKFASHECGATGFSTGLSLLEPSARLPYHKHDCSEAVTVLQGEAEVQIEDRVYHLGPMDCVHFPANVSHLVSNANRGETLITHTAFASAQPKQEMMPLEFPIQDCRSSSPSGDDPGTILRSQEATVYELSPNAFFNDLFARRFGAAGICGGYGRFLSGASLPCHIHDYDESITIVKGAAVCLVQGRQYHLSGYDTAFIPKGIPHRFLNLSGDEMAMLWVYAGDEPDRRILDAGYCSGALAWSAN
jgi:quercetin dioxygenase-like cupin family protein